MPWRRGRFFGRDKSRRRVAPQEALKLLGRAYSLAPKERSVALLYAEAKLRNGESAEASALLEPFAANESDVAFLDTFADALRQAGQLDRARSHS